MRIVVEGCGQWAMQYFAALKTLAGSRSDIGVLFTYDSTFGLDIHAERLSAPLFLGYLQATLRNVRKIQEAGFACVDVKDTLFRLQGRPYKGRAMLPKRVDVVFVVTPDRTHCDVAEYWLGKARWVFVEKPFDVEARRIKRFCKKLRAQPYTQVFAVDHYFVRCNQAAADEQYFLKRLLTTAQDDIISFEFCMTEPPGRDDRGNYNPSAIRERALSVQAGMVFDMGAHALPILLPFVDLNRPIQITGVWAGVSDPLRNILFSGAESFSIARVQGYTRDAAGKSSSPIEGTFIIGKDIGDGARKHLLLEGPKGKVRFDLVHYHVYHEHHNGHVEPLVPLQQNWMQFFVKEVLEGRIPAAVKAFQPESALQVIKFLEAWRNLCQNGRTSQLPGYRPGADVSELKNERYRVK